MALRYASCLLSFAAPDGRVGTAPGQVSVGQLRRVYRAATLGPTTEVFGVLGPSIQDELIETLNTLLARAGRDAVVVPFLSSRPVSRVMSAFRNLPMGGWLLTPRVRTDDLDSVVARFESGAGTAGTVSTVVRRGADLVATGNGEDPEAIVEDWLG